MQLTFHHEAPPMPHLDAVIAGLRQTAVIVISRICGLVRSDLFQKIKARMKHVSDIFYQCIQTEAS